jgi:membrane protease YdiL (CAAX protease family)
VSAFGTAGPEPPGAGPRPAADAAELTVPVGRYIAGVAVTVVAVLSQYFVPELWPATLVVYGNLLGDVLVVYGVPIATFAVLVGAAPLRRWRASLATATWEGLQWYGGLSLLALVVVFVLTVVYEIVDPAALKLLSRLNPLSQEATGNPWFYVAFSFPAGACEEVIFRGWWFGAWRTRGRGWLGPATWTSAIFAAVHVYYGTTYGIAAPLISPVLFLLGFSFAATYEYSGGNLLVPALLHGEYDASAFLYLIAKGPGLLARYVPVLVGLAILLVQFLRPKAAAPGRGPPPGISLPSGWPPPPSP